MRRTILTILGSALLAASTIQIAAAAEHHKAHKVYRSPAPAADQYRNSNAYYPAPAPMQPGWSQQQRYEDWSRYQNGGLSAPAGQ
jgi:hypothetical protein